MKRDLCLCGLYGVCFSVTDCGSLVPVFSAVCFPLFLLLLFSLVSGLVSITAGAATLEPYAALLVGAAGALVYTGTSRAMTYFQVDDPVDATGVHFGCGLWGTLSVGFFSTERLQAIAGFNHTNYGLAYGGGGRLLLCQVIGCAVICAMVTVTITPLFLLLRAFGLLRVSPEQEEAGMDGFCHGGAAYPEDMRPWDTIAVESTVGSPTSPPALGLSGQGPFDPEAVDSLVSTDKSPPGSTRVAGQMQNPRFSTPCSRSMRPTENGTSASFPDGRLLTTVAEPERPAASGLRLSRSADTSRRGSGAEWQRGRSMADLSRRGSEGARSAVSVLPAVPDTELPW